MVKYRFISILFIISTIFVVSFLSSIGGFIDFWSINYRFQFETILSQELGCQGVVQLWKGVVEEDGVPGADLALLIAVH